jgi:hypothetical protein
LKCISSGNDVCECLSKNEIVMIFLHYEEGKIIIQSSLFFAGHDNTYELDLQKISDDKLIYKVSREWPLTDSLVIEVLDNRLYIEYGKNIIICEKQRLKTLDTQGSFSYNTEIYMQRNTLNSQSLLAYLFSDQEGQLISYNELKALIKNNYVTISCSDDFHDNSMWIKKGDSIRYLN